MQEKEFLQQVKSLLADRGPISTVVLLSEIQKEAGDSGVVGDELMVEIGKAKEGVYFPYLYGGRPCSNSIKFHRIHGKLFQFYNHPKVLDFGDVKLTFLEL